MEKIKTLALLLLLGAASAKHHSYGLSLVQGPTARQIKALKENPELVFGGNSHLYNSRDGGEPGSEINLHNDEPIDPSEVTMEDSSASGSDGEETAEEIQYQREQMKRMDSRAQRHSYGVRNKEYV